MTTLPRGYREVRRVDLMRNRKESAIVNILALLITGALIALGFVVCPPFVEFRIGIHTIFNMAFLVIGVIAYMIFHELIHGAFMKAFSGKKPHYGFTGLYAYAGSDAFFARKQYLVIAFAPVVILGGIYGGVFTPTEAAAVACFYGLFVGTVIYRRIGWKELYDVLLETVNATATVMIVCTTAGLYSWIGSTVGLIEKASGLLLGVSSNEYVILFMIYFILFIGGMLLDGVSMVYVFMPILMPLMKQFHWDPVWFGVMVTIMVAVGTITPPVAMNLYVGCRISGLTIEELTPPVIPLMLATLLALVVLTAFPSITLMLPRYLGFM